MVTGSRSYVVRHGFSESYVWRDCSQAMPNSTPLLAMADEGYCLDRPTRIPAGSTGRDDSVLIDIFHQ